MDYRFNFREVWVHKGLFLSGLKITLEMTLVVVILALIVGLIVALVRLRNSRASRLLSRVYIEVFRNCPPLVLLLWAFYVLPILLGLSMSAFLACAIALGLNAAAYMAEIYRSGIQSVERGQIEAGYSLGLSYPQGMRKVILPQAIRVMIPPLLVELVEVLKWSSLVSALGVADLTFTGEVLSNKIFRPMEIFTVIAGIYFVVCYALSQMVRILEKQLSKAY